MIDLLLVNPWPVLFNRDAGGGLRPYFPLGLLYIAAYLKRAGRSVKVFDASLDEEDRDLGAAIRRYAPRVVGLYCTNVTRPKSSVDIKTARDAGAFVILGGPDPSLNPELYLGWGAHGICKGEGEEFCKEALERLEGEPGAFRLRDAGSMAGHYYREGSALRFTGERPYLQDLDALPDPDWTAIPMERFLSECRRRLGFSVISMTTARGCPFHCSWCSKEVYGQSFRKRSVERVAEEMARLKALYKPDQLLFTDDVFTMNASWLRRLSETVVRRDAAIPFECVGRPEQLTEETVGALRAMGCARVALGTESGSQAVLDVMSKGFRVADVAHALARLKRRGIRSEAYAMIGYPGETPAAIRATGEMLAENPPDVLNVTRAFPIRGTPFHNLLKPFMKAPSPSAQPENALPFPAEYPPFYYWLARKSLYHAWLMGKAGGGFKRARHRALGAFYGAALSLAGLHHRPLPINTEGEFPKKALSAAGGR